MTGEKPVVYVVDEEPWLGKALGRHLAIRPRVTGKMGAQFLADLVGCVDELFLEYSSRCLLLIGLRSNILPP